LRERGALRHRERRQKLEPEDREWQTDTEPNREPETQRKADRRRQRNSQMK